MYLSRLTLNQHNRVVRQDLADCQEMHRTILKAFPQVNGDGGARSQLGVLYRLDADGPDGRLLLIVQSDIAPDWGQLPPGYALDVAGPKPLDDAYSRIEPGMVFRFRLRANPTKKIDTKTGPEGKRRNGRRVDLRREEDRLRWLRCKAKRGGFELLAVSVSGEVPDVWVQSQPVTYGRRGSARLTFGSVLFEGRLRVTDANLFRTALRKGVGSAKAYGFGLLSIAPARL